MKTAMAIAIALPFLFVTQAFQAPATRFWLPFRSRLFAVGPTFDDDADDSAIQFELFKKHHLGSWKGIWTTYDYIGDVSLETVASVECELKKNDDEQIDVSHHIVVGAKRSDCATCFDSMEQKTIPVAQYTPQNLQNRKTRLGACGMVVGPSLLRSGAMATELVLRHGDGRVRVILQHAPVWSKDVEPGSCPPQGLKLFRTMVSREAKRATAPTAETEAANPPTERGNPIFYRPVPPFDWHKKWAGTSWTWGPEAGNRGWQIEELEEGDSWHGSAPVELWNLRLPGGVFVQSPRVITGDEVGLCRLAWMPDTETLLRMEVGVQALQPMLLDDDTLVGFAPPTLASMRCDVLQKFGDLEGLPSFAEQMKQEEAEKASANSTISESAVTSTASPEPALSKSRKKTNSSKDDGESELQAIQDALQL